MRYFTVFIVGCFSLADDDAFALVVLLVFCSVHCLNMWTLNVAIDNDFSAF